MTFQITPLPRAVFEPLFGLPDAALAAFGAERVRVEQVNAAPCRLTLEDAAVGESVILVNHEHQPHDTPYRSRHAVFVREGAQAVTPPPGVVPPALRRRLLSVRAFNAAHAMVDADLVDGAEAEALFKRLLGRPDTAYLQAHYARRGCYAARVERA